MERARQALIAILADASTRPEMGFPPSLALLRLFTIRIMKRTPDRQGTVLREGAPTCRAQTARRIGNPFTSRKTSAKSVGFKMMQSRP
jgi:hypothetical protein